MLPTRTILFCRRHLDGDTPGQRAIRHAAAALSVLQAGARRLRLSALAWPSAFGQTSLITNLFTRADWLGYLAIGALVVAILAFLGFVARELSALASLHQYPKAESRGARRSPVTRHEGAHKRRQGPVRHLSHRPETAKGRAALEEHQKDIIDNPGLMMLAEARTADAARPSRQGS